MKIGYKSWFSVHQVNEVVVLRPLHDNYGVLLTLCLILRIVLVLSNWGSLNPRHTF